MSAAACLGVVLMCVVVTGLLTRRSRVRNRIAPVPIVRCHMCHTPTPTGAAATGTRKVRRRGHEQRGIAMADVQGTCDSRFEAMRDILQSNIDSGADLGASV